MKKLKFEYRITFAYLFLGGVWIIFSDKLLYLIVENANLLTEIQTYKGWFFVFVTALILYIFLKKHLNLLRHTEQELISSKEKLGESEKNYKKLIEKIPDGVYKSTHEGEFVEINPAMVKILGYNSKEELLAVDIKNDLYIEDSDRDSIILDELNKELGIYQLRKKDGSLIWVEDHGWYSFDELGEITYHEGIMRDVTERIQKEQELIKAKEKAEESERKLIEAQKLAQVGSWEYIIDTDTVTWSKEIFNIFERSYDLPAPNYSEQRLFYTKESFFLLDKAVQDCVQREIPYEIELDIIVSDGSKKQIISKGNVIKDKTNKIIGCYGTAQDITQKKKNEREIIAAKEKAEESDKLKSAFLANMSHEIRTPMNGILGFSELLKSPNLSGENQHKYIEIIEKSGKRMLNIINDIVDISKIEAGLMNMDIKESNINEQIEYIHTFFKPEAEAKGIRLLSKSTLPIKEAFIKTDKEKLFAILTNLVKNAIKYTEEGSIEFGYEKKGDYLKFFVKDTGVGIPKDRQKAIFERFIQADIKDKMARQGAGLGLSITKAYIEMLGGKIWVESEEGNGSIFYFTLPYNVELKEKNSTKEIEVTNNKENQGKNLKVLIAEDDEVSEILLSTYVSEFSNTIFKATTGTEAIEIYQNNPDIDLILMDIQMPEMNGLEATRQIKAFNKDVIIIAQTAYGLTGDREKSLDAGCNDYITKPINKSELNSLIQKYFTLR